VGDMEWVIMLQTMRMTRVMYEWVSRYVWVVLAGNKWVVSCRGNDPVGLAPGNSNLRTPAFGLSWFLWVDHRLELPLRLSPGQGCDYLLGRFGGI